VALTRNKAVDRLRAGTRRHSRLTSATTEELEPVAVQERTPAHASLTAEVAGVVGAALATLSRDQHQAIEMAFFQGLSQSEIASSLGVPLGTVKARIRRGMLQLREQLTAVWAG
jgi:RNA polymerase sigma-70 factor (ECF subfamily)